MKRYLFAIMVFFIVASLTAQSAYAMRQSNKKRNHSKVNIYDLIMNGLERVGPESGLIWTQPQKEFALKITTFTTYFQKMGKSSAEWNSIKNRLTKGKSGFINIRGRLEPPQGYDLLYSHIFWNDDQSNNYSGQELENNNPELVSRGGLSLPENDPFLAPLIPEILLSMAQKPPMFLPQDPRILPQNTPVYSVLDNVKRTSQYASEPDLHHPEAIASLLLIKQASSENDPYETQRFSFPRFINDFRDTNGNINDFDHNNLITLLMMEEITNDEMMSTQFLSDFGYRFGSWWTMAANQRQFVEDGARNWFHGKCEKKEAEALLKRQIGNHEYYLICSATIDKKSFLTLVHVFTISYRTIGGDIRHHRIFKDELERLCMLEGKDNKIVVFGSFKEIIDRVIKEDPMPVSHYFFKSGLQAWPNRVFGINRGLIEPPDLMKSVYSSLEGN